MIPPPRAPADPAFKPSGGDAGSGTPVSTNAGGRPALHVLPRDGGAPDEGAVVRRAQAGDGAAFDQLYHASVERVHALCLRMTGERARAEELTQDVFVRAWDKLAGFRGESRFGTWLQRLAVNVVLRALRTEKRRLRRFPLADEPFDGYPAGPGTHPGDALDLERAIQGLPPGARAVFVLHDVEGYRHEEIAAMLGIAPGTCKAQLHRARRLLREELEP